MGTGIFRGVVTDAAAATHEQHTDRAELGHGGAVMAGAGGEPQRLAAGRGNGGDKAVLQGRIARRGGDVARGGHQQPEMATLGDGAHLGLEALDELQTGAV